jgi:hypothetical protein
VFLYQGDIQWIEFYSNESKANTFGICMLAAAAFQGYRFIKTQSWASDWMTNEAYSLNFNLPPEGGFLFTFNVKF